MFVFSCLSCFCFLEGYETAEQRRDQLQTQVSDSVGAHLKLVKDGHKPKRTDKKISQVPVEVNESQAKKSGSKTKITKTQQPKKVAEKRRAENTSKNGKAAAKLPTTPAKIMKRSLGSTTPTICQTAVGVFSENDLEIPLTEQQGCSSWPQNLQLALPHPRANSAIGQNRHKGTTTAVENSKFEMEVLCHLQS